MRDHRKLTVWAHAMDLAEAIYRITDTSPFEERFGLVRQIRRSSVSVPSNIAEACGRRSKRDFGYFLGVAGGSLQELETQVSLAVRLGWIDHDDPLHDLVARTSSQLITLRRMVEGDIGPR